MPTILKEESFLDEARALLAPPLMVPNGDVRQEFLFNSRHFSHWLGLRLEEELKNFPDWKKAGPILLGSWARGELCPKSDMDLLFCGEEAVVREMVARLNEQGYKIRYRMPADPEDWTVGVEPFDILALMQARPLTREAATRLLEQQKKILRKRKHHGKILLRAVLKERSARARRFDSITSFLEPNLKYGPGGLRDLEQGLQIYELFAEKIPHAAHTLNVLNYYKSYLLTLRQKLHLEGLGDILVGSAQFDLARWMGFKNQKDFMRDLQRGLSRVNFYTDWLLAAAASPEKSLQKIENLEFSGASDLLEKLRRDPGPLMQKRVREKMDDFFSRETQRRTAHLRGRLLEKILAPASSDALLVAVFRSRWIDKLLPAIRHLVGYVQHDQYHRFTAETHIMQACREFKRVYEKPSALASLRVFHRHLKDYDWKVLRWACLYHDLAKGLESEDHADLGVEILRRDFKAYHFSRAFTDDVAWLVKNHLELSAAAFRKNPKALKVWQDLQSKGVSGGNLYRLAIFTAIDIRATNPEAWNDWKSRLLKELVLNLESKSARQYFDFHAALMKKKLRVPVEIYEELDPLLLDAVPLKLLVDDLKKAQGADENLKPLVVKTRNDETWIRFHRRKDRAGVLADYVGQLYSLGMGVRHASIQTLPKIGIYDWFQVQTGKSSEVLRQLLEHARNEARPAPAVNFSQIDLISADEKEWIISFKGLNQSGLLAAASQALAEAGVSVRSARVHTWGRQIEDVFILKPAARDPQALVADLRGRFVPPAADSVVTGI